MNLSNALVFSIAPAWVDLIVRGIKTVELRRRVPKALLSAHALIYETHPKRQIGFFCRVGPVISGPPDDLWPRVGESTGTTREVFEDYFSGVSVCHAIIVREVTALRTPLTLAQLRDAIGFQPPQSWCRASQPLLDLVKGQI